jgi:hypothetical protein
MSVLLLALALVALILAVVELVRSRGTSLCGWAIGCLAIIELAGRLR